MSDEQIFSNYFAAIMAASKIHLQEGYSTVYHKTVDEAALVAWEMVRVHRKKFPQSKPL